MSLEIRPLNTNCNLSCRYCYQAHAGESSNAGNAIEPVDMAVIMDELKKVNRPFAVFGGEPLLIPKNHLEELFALGFQRFKHNVIQTNGTLLDDDHIRMFKKYNVYTGISIDGPGQCNDYRWAGTLEKTRKATAKTEAAVEKLCRQNVQTSLIITMHRKNAAVEKLSGMSDWLLNMNRLGIHHVRLHLMETDDSEIRRRYALSARQSIDALMKFAGIEEQLGTKFIDLFYDIRSLLLCNDRRASCTWRGCDFYNTAACGLLGNSGEIINCGHTHKWGVEFLKAGQMGYQRLIALYFTPRAHGGCSGCRFFLACKGWCPASGIDGDWRNRTRYCEIWEKLFEYFENRLLLNGETPLSLLPYRKDIEWAMVKSWTRGRNPTIQDLVEALGKNSRKK